jgi:hypothetical protein
VRLSTANPLHPKRVTELPAFSIVGIFGLLVIDGTVTADDYLSQPIDDCVPVVMEPGILTNSAWFQNDGARSHTSNAIPHLLYDIFKDTVLPTCCPTIFEEGFYGQQHQRP